VGAIVGMLTDTATLAMPPIPSWYRGRDAIEMVLRRAVFDGRRSWRMVATSANGQLAVGAYELNSSGVYAPHGVTVLTLRDELIDGITHFALRRWSSASGYPLRRDLAAPHAQ
jgi:RNA polymerase sigma-70 factor, ECF subfamily